jgi:hypothetical protein
MHWVRTSMVAVIAAAMGSCAAATTAVTTPDNFQSVISSAPPGSIIVLSPGEYRGIRIAKRRFDPAVTIDASKATLIGLIVSDSEGLVIQGGEFRLPPPVTKPSTGVLVYGSAFRGDRVRNIAIRDAHFVGAGHPDTGSGFAYGEGYGVLMTGSDLIIENSSFTGFAASIFLNRVDRFRVSNITSTAVRSDGIDVAESHHGVIEGVQCSGTVIRDTEHPDCIQLWSRKTSAPTSDIVIRRNSVVGNTQGISLFNHADKGNDNGGFDRITIEDNDVAVSAANGISLIDGRDSIVRRNRVRTLENARFRASLNAPGAQTCGNVVEAGAGKPGVSDAKC